MQMREIRRPVRTDRGQLIEVALRAQYLEGEPHLLDKLVEENDQTFIEQAVFIRDVWAVSHRGFLVGVCAVGLANGLPIFLEGANHSPVRGIQRNCGEMGVLAQANSLRGLGEVTLKYMYVAGPSDRDEIASSAGKNVATLPPCDECRPMLYESPHTTPDLVVTTIAGDPSSLVVERDTLGGIIAAYTDVAPPPSSEMLLVG